jgi:hypothetical protein
MLQPIPVPNGSNRMSLSGRAYARAGPGRSLEATGFIDSPLAPVGRGDTGSTPLRGISKTDNAAKSGNS